MNLRTTRFLLQQYRSWWNTFVNYVHFSGRQGGFDRRIRLLPCQTNSIFLLSLVEYYHLTRFFGWWSRALAHYHLLKICNQDSLRFLLFLILVLIRFKEAQSVGDEQKLFVLFLSWQFRRFWRLKFHLKKIPLTLKSLCPVAVPWPQAWLKSSTSLLT